MTKLITISMLVGAIAFAPSSLYARKHIEFDEALPEFTAKTLGGTSVASSSFKGKILVLAYLRPGQKYSTEAMIEIDRAMLRYGAKGVHCLVVCTDAKGAQAYAAELKKIMAMKELTIAFDEKGAILAKLGVMVSPTTLVFDKELKLKYRLPQISPAYGRNLHAHIRLLLGDVDEEVHDEILQSNGAVERWMFNHHGSRVSLARELIMVTEEARALQELEGLIKDPHDDLEQLQALKCIALLNIGKMKEAESLFPAIVKSGQSILDVQMAKVRIAFERGDLSSAGKSLLSIKAGDAEIRRLVKGLGRLPLAQHRRKHAKAYTELIEGKVGDSTRE